MSPRTVAVVGLNLGVLLASHLAFRAWILDRFGYLDPDMLGGTSIAWVPLVVATTIAVAMSGRFLVMRLVAWPLIAVVAVIVVDHGLGALRDGSLSLAGLATGAFMILQVVVLVGSLGVMRARSTGLARPGRGAVIAGSILAIVLAVTAAIGGVSGAGPKEAAVRAWLQDLAGGAEDRGWSHLDTFPGPHTDRASYIAGARSVEWSRFDWRIAHVDEHDGSWMVEIAVADDAIPDFFFEHRLAQPLCVDGRRTGLLVFVETALIGRATVSGGAFTGTAERGACAAAVAVPAEAAPVRWANQPGWTGAALEVWNRTVLDLFLLDRAGRRVDVPACGHVATSALDIGDMVEVRAEEGYVLAFGATSGRRRSARPSS